VTEEEGTREPHVSFEKMGSTGRDRRSFRARRPRSRLTRRGRCPPPAPALKAGPGINQGVVLADYTAAVNARGIEAVQTRRRARASLEGSNTLPPVRILILMSDTGGGHRASAQAMEKAFEELWPGAVHVDMVDIWTEHSAWPTSEAVSAYQYAAKKPLLWRGIYEFGRFPPTRWFQDQAIALLSFSKFRRAMQLYDPDFVVSVHPMCQTLPLQVLRDMGGGVRDIPFVTVVTDLGGAHPQWFDPEADKVFIASAAVMRTAFRVGVDGSRIHMLGLPVRQAFWARSTESTEALRLRLGLKPKCKTVLVVGGGDGVGGIASIATALIRHLGSLAESAQVIVVCGKNEAVQHELSFPKRPWPSNIFLSIQGFVKNMEDWMGAANCIVTKAGPGTIAEANTRGLPVMLSAFLPGQEEGNVPFVENGGFGAYSKSPSEIAKTVGGWLHDDVKLQKMSDASFRAARPRATIDIVREIGAMIFMEPGKAIP
jgi:1,2-diacylglycerol 3-beta-galactosyltransferase